MLLFELTFHSSEHVRPDSLLQLVDLLGVLQRAEVVLEHVRVGEHVRLQERKQGEQLGRVVLDLKGRRRRTRTPKKFSQSVKTRATAA